MHSHVGKKHFFIGYINCRNRSVERSARFTFLNRWNRLQLGLHLGLPQSVGGYYITTGPTQVAFHRTGEQSSFKANPSRHPWRESQLTTFPAWKENILKKNYEERLAPSDSKMHNDARVITLVYNQGRNREINEQITGSGNRPPYVWYLTCRIVFEISKGKLH